MSDLKIGFIGQGWIGKNYADDFEARGYEVVRYSIEGAYLQNKEKIQKCDLVFIAVPTPTTQSGFDDSVLRSVIPLIGQGKSAVIKSTVLPGTTEAIQEKHSDIYLFHSPEFLSVATAAEDARHPQRNIVGYPIRNQEYLNRAQQILDTLPKADYEILMSAYEAELFKYLRNCFFYTKVVYMNMIYDLARQLGCDWNKFRDIMSHDPWIGNMHIDPIHKSGRGAGGECFIKDFAALKEFYFKHVNDEYGFKLFDALEHKNLDLLINSNKDMDYLKEVYGEELVNTWHKNESET